MKEDDFKQFIEFGALLDKGTRRYLVRYLLHRFNHPGGELEALAAPSAEFDLLKETLDRVFSHETTLQVLGQHDALATQVVQDTLQWMRKTHQRVKTENPYQEEFRRLGSWQERPLRIFAETWYHLTQFLKENYTREELDVLFYQERFDDTFRDRKAFLQRLDAAYREHGMDWQHPIERIIQDLLTQWEALLIARSLRYEMERMEEEREEFSQLLYQKVEEFQKLLDLIAPFTLDVGRFWDLDKGLWKKHTFNVLERYAEILQNEHGIRQLAQLLGRWRDAETELDEQLYARAISKSEWKTVPGLRGEISGVHESDDLPNVLPTEAALLGTPVTETLFFKKYLEKRLLTFQYQGEQAVKGRDMLYEQQAQQKAQERGPFIICIDTSGSMEGTPEHIAKVLCFAVLKMAARERRHAYLISFSVGLHTINLMELETSMDKIVDFLNRRFDGGTDISPAMHEALRMLDDKDYEDADVLMVSDFVMYDIREDIVRQMHKKQKTGTRFHSLTLAGAKTNPEIVDLFDNYWVYDPDNREVVRQLASDLRSISRVS
ncbi:Uncharacterized protein, contains a von Willebrand factor type A (vWA) domain [Catalinimonas alkaloidigena]|uniref:Uncharacterized protein, contains a von Willebrand factor type A (VWA) domain n=1 Tax=Catalinimonas alkaloidigena TaxID=1075417 RepID=A0A1G9PFI4_9BACT|nr:VWA domain-containing protein [Catalinimonas alkaloidigena]SDL97251.1 Uncharacterized protein, contains a von Willebrand factor type A (vWA) domain [Catalinimonas alkaloidigena]